MLEISSVGKIIEGVGCTLTLRESLVLSTEGPLKMLMFTELTPLHMVPERRVSGSPV
jgi:hypothetical protein